MNYNIPGFITETVVKNTFRSRYIKQEDSRSANAVVMQRSRLSAPFSSGMLSIGESFECSGSCPDGKILCRGKNNCVCCSDGCIELIGGDVKCGLLHT